MAVKDRTDEPTLRCHRCWGSDAPVPGLIVGIVHTSTSGFAQMTIAHRIADRTTEEVSTVCGSQAPAPGREVLWYA